ncbi:hypothetical protein [Terribacillus sp. DMT04]|uniref:hypothetical protein n=1 Tax=Terribacillus sp. DMT04 TaxID=2850441 RepID=UPI001C2BFFA8|nr:hypothetical protein [Terribacillus sp. DMT04]QXE00989.1 hypothetical protein KS242_13410 [Terribacillus sp. DMT04]
MLQNKQDIKKILRISLLLYSILIGLAGSVSIIAALILIPKEELQYFIEPFIVLGLFIYGTCAVALFIRTKIFKEKKNE